MRQSISNFIVIEGIDGTGKTTIANALVDLFNESGRHSLYTDGFFDKFKEEKKKYISGSNNDPQKSYEFFMSAMHLASKKILTLATDKIVVCDRYIYSTIAYHRHLGAIVHDPNELNVIQPKLLVNLICSDEAIRQDRLRKKRNPSKYDMLTLRSGNYMHLVQNELCGNARHHIDTTSTDIQTIAKGIVQLYERT